VDVAGFQRGETDALSAFLGAHTRLVWQLARRGFATTEDDRPALVFGVHRAASLEKLTVSTLSEALRTERRARVAEPKQGESLLLETARLCLTAAAQAEGRERTLDDREAEALPSSVIDLDRVELPLPDEQLSAPPRDVEDFELEAFEKARSELASLEEHLAVRDRELLERRLRSAEPRADVARALSISVPAVKEGERRLVRHLLHHLRRARVLEERAGEAELEALLSGDPKRASLPPRTAERIREQVLKRTFSEEPRPYKQRATLALAVAAIALALYALMFFGVIPGPGSDPEIEPQLAVSCAGQCTASSVLEISVRAPRRARRISLWLRSADSAVQPLVAHSDGRASALPFGAKERLTPLPVSATLPKNAGPAPYEVIAVFTSERASIESLRAHVEGSALLPKALTLTRVIGP
jgi:hypothetical protein